jgi:hypothetical protein
VKDEAEYGDRMVFAAEAAAKGQPQFVEEGFFEYHIYTLQRTSTLKENQTKQINLITAGDIPVKKELVFRGASHYYHSQRRDLPRNEKVGVFVEIENRKENNLGIPLPKGTVRVYKKDNQASLQFIGEDRIDHTAKDEKVRVKLGEAFDVVGSRKQTDWKKLASDIYEAAFEISLRNHKDEEVIVKVVEPVPGDWKIVESSHSYTKTEAFEAEFTPAVPGDKEVKITYRVRMRF